MIFRYSPLLLLVAAFVVVGCDQGSQNPDFSTGNTYIIRQEGSAVGDATKDSVTVPDSVDYFVQAFTTEKDYTWTVNDQDPPVQTEETQTHVWSEDKRGPEGVGEFITVVFGPGDPITSVDAPETTHTVTVDASPDDINPRTIEVNAALPNIGAQVQRLSSFSTLSGLANSSGVAEVLGGDGPFTLFAPRKGGLTSVSPLPSQDTDSDEPITSSVLGDLLKYHAVAADIGSADISDGQTETTLFGDQTVTFSVSNGAVTINDGPQVVRPDLPVNNGALHTIDGFLTPSTASLDFTDRTKDPAPEAGDVITVQGSFFPEGGGFVVLHDSTERANQGAIPSIIGSSDFVPVGINNEIEVTLDEPISDTTAVEAMAHRDTNDNMQLDFVSSGGTEDVPYLLEGAPVIDVGVISVP